MAKGRTQARREAEVDPFFRGWKVGSPGALRGTAERSRPIYLYRDGDLMDEISLGDAKRLKRTLDVAVQRVERMLTPVKRRPKRIARVARRKKR